MRFLIILFVFGVLGETTLSTARAQQSDDEALTQTQQLLVNPTERRKVVESDPKAREAHNTAVQLLGSGGSVEDAYRISAEILPIIAAQAKNDPDKMMNLLQEAQRNPEKFLQSLPSSIQQEISSISSRVEKRKTPLKQNP